MTTQFNGLSDADLEVSIVTWSSRWRDKARPITSNPGPILAEEQGILIENDEEGILESLEELIGKKKRELKVEYRFILPQIVHE